MRTEVAAANNFADLYAAYKLDFPIERVLTTDERKKADAKAHVVMEYLEFEFKYVPLGGKHVYLFKNTEQAQAFDKYTGKGR